MSMIAANMSNIEFKKVVNVAKKIKSVAGRFEKIGTLKNKSLVILDYAHTPDALKICLQNIKDQFQNRKISLVFGCGGERDKNKRPMMGKIANNYCDKIYLTDDNPRSENPSKIVADIYAAVTEHPDVRIEHDRARAIKEAVLGAGPDDIVLVAGKGHETWQYLAGERREFKDHAVIEEVLGGKA